MASSSQFTLSAVNLRPCFHQVGGHMSKDEVPESYVDDDGRFYKPYEEGPRAHRELAFYRAVFSDATPRPHVAYPSADHAAPASGPASAEPCMEDVEGFKSFLPKFWGTLEHDGRKLIAMEDMCKQYEKPCVIDCKMGFTTVYDWAEEKYKARNKMKDEETTQSTVGFRISGLQVYRAAEGAMFKPERQWGKTLTKETIGSAFQLFASGGLLAPKDLYGHPELGALKELKRLQAWALKQKSFQFYQASVLLMYDGQAETMQEAKLRVAFVDFAYTFQSLGARDENLVKALASLISVIEGVATA